MGGRRSLRVESRREKKRVSRDLAVFEHLTILPIDVNALQVSQCPSSLS